MVPQPFQAQQAQNRIPPPTGPCLRLPSLSGAKDPSRCPEENRWLSSWALLPTPKPFPSTPNSSHVHPSSLPASRHSCNLTVLSTSGPPPIHTDPHWLCREVFLEGHHSLLPSKLTKQLVVLQTLQIS